MRFRIYADTSVLGGCEDEEFAEHSVRLMEQFMRGEYILVLAVLTVQELASAPTAVRQRLAVVPEEYIETLQLSAGARDLAEAHRRLACSPPRCGPTRSTPPWRPSVASAFAAADRRALNGPEI